VQARQRHALRAPPVHGLSVDGGFAERVLVDERSLLALPAGIEPASVAPHADAGLTAYHAVRKLAHLATLGRPRS